MHEPLSRATVAAALAKWIAACRDVEDDRGQYERVNGVPFPGAEFGKFWLEAGPEDAAIIRGGDPCRRGPDGAAVPAGPRATGWRSTWPGFPSRPRPAASDAGGQTTKPNPRGQSNPRPTSPPGASRRPTSHHPEEPPEMRISNTIYIVALGVSAPVFCRLDRLRRPGGATPRPTHSACRSTASGRSTRTGSTWASSSVSWVASLGHNRTQRGSE